MWNGRSIDFNGVLYPLRDVSIDGLTIVVGAIELAEELDLYSKEMKQDFHEVAGEINYFVNCVAFDRLSDEAILDLYLDDKINYSSCNI